MSSHLPRGIRNNNPGNIRHGDSWRGLAPGQTDPDFCVFTSPEYGIRAMARILLNYQKKYGIRTVDGIISRWAPPSENNTKSYIAAVARACQVAPTEIIDIAEYLPDIVQAIIHHENGMQPYDAATLQRGLALALQ